jgi:multicomponent Na+:H+ antiporter subunit C
MIEDGSIFNQLLVERLNYFIYILLLLIGLWAMISKNNLIKKLIGMSIFQTAIILFYVSIAVKEGATIPIYLPEHDPHGAVESNSSAFVLSPQVLEASLVSSYTNPLPHVLMLTAIVVGVATLGLALSVCLRIYRGYGTMEEDELLEKLIREDSRDLGEAKKHRPRKRRTAPKEKSQEKTIHARSSTKLKAKKEAVRSTGKSRVRTGSKKSSPKVKTEQGQGTSGRSKTSIRKPRKDNSE